MLWYKRRSSIKNAKTRLGADCNTDHQLLLAVDMQIRLKKHQKTQILIKLDYTSIDNGHQIKITDSLEPLLEYKEEKNTKRTLGRVQRRFFFFFIDVAKSTVARRRKKNNQ